ncbi:MAG: DUF2807 domain-containing protein [Bacteroidales bacterium]|nr:DUF2807 domain-containing protein [Bacteroidales bacterium]
MKKIFTFLAVSLIATLTLSASPVATDPAGAKTETKEYRLSGFDELSASFVYSVELSRSSKFSVIVEAPDYLVPYLDVTVRDGKLKLNLKELPLDIRRKLETSGRNDVRASVSMPTLRGLDLSGAAKLNAGDVLFPAGKEFELKMSGASNLKGLVIETREAEIRCNGAAKFNLKGSFSELDIELSGAAAGSLDTGLKPGTLASVDLELSGAAKLTLDSQVSKMELEASGAANIHWKGSADELELNGSGAAKIHASDAPAGQAKITLSGAAKAMVNVQKEMAVRLSGASTCHYKAGAGFRITNQNISRGSSLKQM